MSILELCGLALALAYGVFQRAGVTAEWNWVLCAIGIVGALHYGLPGEDSHTWPNRATTCVLIVFVGLIGLQVVPLPVSVVAVLSPARGELVQAAAAGLGSAPRWATLSVTPAATLQYLLKIGRA